MGKCHDTSCETFGREICIQKKFGTFDLNSVCKELVCLCCKGKLSEVKRIFLTGCVYTISGTLKDGKSLRYYPQNIRNNKSMKLFDTFSELALKWKNFTLIVEEIPVEPRFSKAQWVIGGSVILVAAFVLYNMKNAK